MTSREFEFDSPVQQDRHNRQPIRIVYLIDQIWSGHGGTENQLLSLISGLDRRRFTPELHVMYGKGTFVGSNQAPCAFHCPDLKSMRQPGYWLSLAAIARGLRRGGPTVLHTIFPECVTSGPWLARAAGVPHLTWRRDLGYWLTPAKRRLLRFGGRWTSCCVANSEAVRERVIQNEGLRPEQVEVVRNFVDFDELDRVQPRDVGRELELAPETVSLAFPANLRPVKGGDVVLRALVRARAAGAALHLVSIGENSELLAEYEAYCAKQGISAAVTFLGHLPRAEVLQWVKGCDIALNASYSEGYSNGIVEAMVLARPLIATAVGGNREQVVEGSTGLLVPVGDEAAMAEAMLALYHDRGRRLAMGEAGAARMRAVHGENLAVEQHEDLYERLLALPRFTDEG